ncbi:retrotransposon-like protein 1 [Peromyscus californicus insignis]|uniref:retrotransposon-like protein 1 n=1 Tax=Peromyscus californicus insignis TaxID=564181 RepID=UPI0022A6ED8E|nr:retrotransposon-like protein 1 [Peromyscus californicus insignis]XP_052594932.1 retrotransposon-like protein 1 [Peromyscus californicus insignis]
MIEPSEDSFETMMELNNPSSKQMESSEGSSNTVEETPGSSGAQAQAEAGSDSGPAQEGKEPPSGSTQEMQELPIDLYQNLEEPFSGLYEEREKLPTDLLQDMEATSGPREERDELPTDLLQELEESSSGPCEEREKLPTDTLENMEEPSSGPSEEREKLPTDTLKNMEEPSSDPCEEQEELPTDTLKNMEKPSSDPCEEQEELPTDTLKNMEKPSSDPCEEQEELSTDTLENMEEPSSGPSEEREEMPTDSLEDVEEPSSGPSEEREDPPSDLLQDMEESCDSSHEEGEDPLSEIAISSDGIDSVFVNSSETQTEQGDETDLEDEEDEENLEEEGQPGSSPEQVMATMESIISVFLRMQDIEHQQRVAERILMQAIEEGRLPKLRHFSGDRREYHEFIVLCQMTLQNYPSMLHNDQLRVKFVMCHLSDLALEWANSLVEQNSPLLNNYSGFIEAMSEMFEYRQTLRVAEDAMFNIRQGNRGVAEYINEFQSLIPTLGWPDEVLQAHLCQGLNEDIRHYLFRIPQPESLENLMVLVLQIEDKLAERRAILRLPPEARPRNMIWLDPPAPEKWSVSSWLPNAFHPNINRAHLFLLLMVRVNPYHSVAVQALVDSGAEGNYMDEKFAQEHYVELYERPYPQAVQTVDGSLIGNEPIWLYTEPLMCIQQNHCEYIEFDIVPSPHFSVVLGIKWLRTHAPEVDWIKGRCTFHSPYCLKNCFHPPPPCIALEKVSMAMLPGLPQLYSDLADVFNPKEADDETSDQPSSDGSDDLSESEPSELQQAGDSDHNDVFYESSSKRPCQSVSAKMQEKARQQEQYWILYDMLNDRQDYIQMMPELFEQLHGATWFTKLELRDIAKEPRVDYSLTHTEDTWRATFGLSPYQMRCYRPFTIDSYADDCDNEIHFILKDILGFYVIAHGRELLIYSMSQEEHFDHVRQVLLRLRGHNIHCSLDKSQFHRQTAEIMGFALSPKGVKLNKTIMNLIMGCTAPSNRKGLQTVIELFYPYRHFVEHFAIIAEPLVRLLLSTETYCWGEEHQEALDCLKRAFRKAPILYHPKHQNPFYLETGITGSFLYASLIQTDEETGKKATCAFYSRHLSPIEVEYPQVEMRILPIRASLIVWCRYLENTEEPIMILLNTEDLASLNNDRLTVLLPGHWLFFFSHFHFDVMELPDDDDPRALSRRNPNQRAVKGRYMRPLMLLALRANQRDSFSDSESETETETESKDSDDESDPEWAELNRQALVQEVLSNIPIEHILNSLLTHFSRVQIRSIVLHFFRGLLYWKSVLGVASLLAMMRVTQPLSPLPAPSLEVARPEPRHTLRLILDSSLIAGSGMATAITQLLSQMPPVARANTLPARELAELYLSPRCWHRNALHSQPPRGLRFTPGFWLTLCEFFGVRVNPEEDIFPDPHQQRYLELHVVGDEDVVLREALQDDLQRYRQCGLHDGLQDTSQDAQDNDVQEALLGDQEAVTFRPRNLMDPEVLDFLNNRLLYILGADGRLTLLSRDEVARALTRFLTMASRMALLSPAREQARLEALSDSSDDELD